MFSVKTVVLSLCLNANAVTFALAKEWPQLNPDINGAFCFLTKMQINEAHLGLGSIATSSVLPKAGGNGILVTHVSRRSAAEDAGIRPGDVIFKIGNIEMQDVSQLDSVRIALKRAATLPVSLLHNGKPVSLVIHYSNSVHQWPSISNGWRKLSLVGADTRYILSDQLYETITLFSEIDKTTGGTTSAVQIDLTSCRHGVDFDHALGLDNARMHVTGLSTIKSSGDESITIDLPGTTLRTSRQGLPITLEDRNGNSLTVTIGGPQIDAQLQALAYCKTQLRTKTSSTGPRLGMTLMPMTKFFPQVFGMLVTDFPSPNGPAGAAGVKYGDLIGMVNGHFIRGFSDYKNILSSLTGAHDLSIEVVRKGDIVPIKMKLYQ